MPFDPTHPAAIASTLAARPVADVRAAEHARHWQALLDRGLIGPPPTPAQIAARAACERSVRAFERVLSGRAAA